MKKTVSIILVLLICLSVLCSCGGSGTQLSVSKNGTTNKMTVSEIIKLEDTDGRTFEEKVKNSSISGKGKITSIGTYEADAWEYGSHEPVRYSVEIYVNDDVRLIVSCKKKMNLYVGDEISFTGTYFNTWMDRVSLTLTEQNISVN